MNNIKTIIFKFALLSQLAITSVLTIAQDYSYIYIEGDKETPFYVKMEGQMMPRLAQNYAVLSNLDAGVTNIEILFQQNKYSPIKFAIKVPKNAPRGLVLRKVDSEFALYDIQTGHYILPGNKPSDDNISALESKYYAQKQEIIKNNKIQSQAQVEKKQQELENKIVEEKLPSFNPTATLHKKETPKNTIQEEKKKTQASEKNKITKGKNTEKKPKDLTVANKTQENKIDNLLSLSAEAPNLPPSDKSKKYLDKVIINNDEENKLTSTENSTLPPNTDCKTAMTDEEFDAFFDKIKGKEDESKIKYLNKNKKQCYTTEQVSIIARSIKSTSGKLVVVKDLYAQTIDQHNYKYLEHIFPTEYLKKKFKESININ